MRRFRGKNAWWLILIFIISNILPLNILFKADVTFDIALLSTFVFYYIVFDVIFLPILIRNHIDLYEDYFIFYYGFSKRKVMIQKIKKIEKSRDMTASSANSLDRIYIETKDDEFMISLKENNEFIEVIRNRMSYYQISACRV